MERELLNQIWPIFSAEAREHLSAISSGVMELEDDPSRTQVLDGVRRTAHSLKGSAGSLGLSELERLAHAIEGSLSKYDPAEGISHAVVMAALDAVQAIEQALEAGDAGGDPAVPRLPELLASLGAAPPPDAGAAGASEHGAPAAEPPEPPPPVATGPLALLERLEDACSELVQPLEDKERKKRARAAAELARELAAAVASSPLPGRIAEGFAKIASGGPEAARFAAGIAGDLVELRGIFEKPASPPAPAPGSAPAPAAPAPAAPAAAAAAAADKSIRVLASTMDSLSRQLELLSLGESRHRRRAGQVREVEQALRECIRGLERVGHALRIEQPDEARAELAPTVERLRTLVVRLARLTRETIRDADGQRLTSTLLREDLRALRMVPASVALEPLRRAVRDVAGRTGKEVDLVLSGADVRLDRRVVDELRDPLLHLVRNAVDHGIEVPEARRRAGKLPRGQLRVRVELRGTRVGVVVEDDGGGLDVAAVKAAAVRRGVVTAEQAGRLSDADAAQLVFQSGLSTAATVTEISGRGVGLDVVQDTAHRLQGTVTVAYEPGKWTRFDVEVPLSLSASAALLLRVGRDLAAIPADTVARVLLLREGDIGTVAGRATVRVGGMQLPYAPVSTLLGMSAGSAPARGRFQPALVVAVGGQRVVIGIEEVVGQQEIVVSPLGARLARVPHLAGAAVLDDGRVVGVLAAGELVRRVQPAAQVGRSSAPARPRIIVADDSLTTRAAMKALLEIAGYTVIAAGDGEEAWQHLTTGGAQVVVSDVQMPRLDGFDLTRRIKADPRLRSTPVVLVTSLDAPEDRAMGLDAGADGYLVKREVERGKLLEMVRQLLPERSAVA
ncbi:MAG TPA: response regulator [Anaeromyxobacter sp.]|nr:response regulator [Anaeromyxobacter sp.]